ncbi:MAG: glycosyltransferase family 4 protein [Proteobacteria bacterium]|nr:glycosyltransferase family 4 protein [Pseudomonadota bacterium]
MELELLNDCQSSADFASDQVAELRRLGLSSCMYFVVPAYDFGGPDWHTRRKTYRDRSKFKVLMLGNLGTMYSKSGLRLFADEILPILEEKLGHEKVEVHLVGGGTLPPDLAGKLETPMVKIRGWVESAAEEYLSADVVLVPNPVRLGQRTSVLHAFSCGACVVAHEANIAESPDLVADQNILTGNTGAEITEAVIRALADPDLRDRVGANGRSTFEKYFSGKATVPRMVQELERIAGERAKTTPGLCP